MVGSILPASMAFDRGGSLIEVARRRTSPGWANLEFFLIFFFFFFFFFAFLRIKKNDLRGITIFSQLF
jgi:hypothetical protein